MKLTIKDQPDKTAYSEKTQSQDYHLLKKFKKFDQVCCDIQSQNSRNILIRPRNKQQQIMYQVIKNDCLTIYTRLIPKLRIDILQDIITKTLYRHSVRYQPWIGYLCTHCYYHYQNQNQRFAKIGQFLKKFRPAFQQKKCAQSILSETTKRIMIYCSDSVVVPSYETIQKISKKYQQTFLLEFVPIQYSKYMIQRYLSEDGDLQQYLRLSSSLAHFVLNTCNPVNQAHYQSLMTRPYMGAVEWPIIIANRHIFQSQPQNKPVIEKS